VTNKVNQNENVYPCIFSVCCRVTNKVNQNENVYPCIFSVCCGLANKVNQNEKVYSFRRLPKPKTIEYGSGNFEI
jgi:hypothetical protein